MEDTRGGGNPSYGQTFLISRDAWLGLHDWFALVMVLGVLVHLALHWRWIYHMFRGLWRQAFSPRRDRTTAPEECPVQ